MTQKKDLILEALRERFQYDLNTFASAMNVKLVTSQELTDNKNGFIHQKNGQVYICVKSNLTKEKQREILIKIMSEYFLHNDTFQEKIESKIY